MIDSYSDRALDNDKSFFLSIEMITEAYKKSHDQSSFFEVLHEHTGNSKGELLVSLANALGYKPLMLSDLSLLKADFDSISYAESIKRNCVVVINQDEECFVVTANPFDAAAQSWIGNFVTRDFSWALTLPEDLKAYLMGLEANVKAMESALQDNQRMETQKVSAEDLSLLAIRESSSAVVRLVHSTLHDALKAGASDVHLESVPDGLAVKFRIDGVLVSMGSFPGNNFANEVLSRVKIMAELDISEKRVPQDGRFKVAMNNREIDMRVSVIPSVHGEDAVLRILDRRSLSEESTNLHLEHLGFKGEMLEQLRRQARAPYGMLLVTGPTGSGKTTTLYAALGEINNGRDKIITIEDPVEYQLPGVLQIPVNEKKGLTFARGLRSILRHDPDKILVGEIRDTETAQMAVQSALTGHLVFTTVHANNPFDVIGRFTHMGVDAYALVSALNCVLAQRLVRLICPYCAEDQHVDDVLLMRSGIADISSDYRFRHGRGCGQCRGSGYRGRKAIGELLVLNDELRELIIRRASSREIKEAAYRNGTKALREAAMEMVMQGETSLEEIDRVTFAG